MCGRFTLAASPDEIREEFGVAVPDGYQPRYNIAPQQPILVVGLDASGKRQAAFLRWGLVPFWANSPRDLRHTINARAESLLLKPAFREAFLNRRCLVIADGFYEWLREGNARRPFRFRLGSGRLMALAGVWEHWKREGEEPIYSCAIVTTPASPAVEPVHDRMPAILTPAEREAWLNPTADPGDLVKLLHPFVELEAYEVSTLVNSVANDVPECIQAT